MLRQFFDVQKIQSEIMYGCGQTVAWPRGCVTETLFESSGSFTAGAPALANLATIQVLYRRSTGRINLCPMSSPQLLPKPESTSFNWALAIPIGAILVSHYFVDIYSSLIPPLVGVVQNEFSMTPELAAILIGIGSLCSGLAQPVFAWVSDRLNTRWCGSIGLVLAALGITLIGFSPNLPSLFAIYAIGMLGVGMFHPIAASTIGKLAGDRRGMAISWFFVFGMAGFFTGSLTGPPLATGVSLQALSYLILPGLVMAVVLQLSIGKIEHKDPKAECKSVSMRDYDWISIGCLFLSSVFRYFVYTAIVYLLVRWMEQYVGGLNPEWSAEKIADASAPLAGRANAVMILGQGIGGLVAGALIVTGHEKWPLVLTPVLCGLSFIAIANLEPGVAGYTACFFAGIAAQSMTPVAISLAQRLMPYHTSLASGMILGGAWALACTGPRIAEWIIKNYSLEAALMFCFALSIASGLSASGIRKKSLLAET